MITGTREIMSFNRAGSLRNLKDQLKKYNIGIGALQEEINDLTMLKII
jgi:hypothetical protein